MFRRNKGLSFRKQKVKINIPIFKEIALWVFEIAIVISIAFSASYFLCGRTNIIGNSMEPGLYDKSEVLINRLSYLIAHPKVGDVIVFLPNGNEKSHYYVKRVVARGGDTVKITDGVLYVNGEPSNISFNGRIKDAGVAENEITLAADECFVMGDNPSRSEDSRYASIGNVKYEYIVGSAWFKVLPVDNIGFIH